VSSEEQESESEGSSESEGAGDDDRRGTPKKKQASSKRKSMWDMLKPSTSGKKKRKSKSKSKSKSQKHGSEEDVSSEEQESESESSSESERAGDDDRRGTPKKKQASSKRKSMWDVLTLAMPGNCESKSDDASGDDLRGTPKGKNASSKRKSMWDMLKPSTSGNSGGKDSSVQQSLGVIHMGHDVNSDNHLKMIEDLSGSSSDESFVIPAGEVSGDRHVDCIRGGQASPVKKRKRARHGDENKVSDVLTSNIGIRNNCPPQPYILPRFAAHAQRQDVLPADDLIDCAIMMEGETSDDDDASSFGCASVDNMTIKINFVDEVEQTNLQHIAEEEEKDNMSRQNNYYTNLHVDFNSPLKPSGSESGSRRWQSALICEDTECHSISKYSEPSPRLLSPRSPIRFNAWYTEPYRIQQSTLSPDNFGRRALENRANARNDSSDRFRMQQVVIEDRSFLL